MRYCRMWGINFCGLQQVYEVEGSHDGLNDRSVGSPFDARSPQLIRWLDAQVIYNPNVPLCPYNVENMVTMRKAFRGVVPPPDF